jgi:RNA polymerase primary sigma factor
MLPGARRGPGRRAVVAWRWRRWARPGARGGTRIGGPGFHAPRDAFAVAAPCAGLSQRQAAAAIAGRVLACHAERIRYADEPRRQVHVKQDNEKIDMAEARTRRRRRAPRVDAFATSPEEQSALDQYLREVSQHELLTPEQEYQLGARAREGDQDAIDALVRANLRFVISVAKKYQNRGVSLIDLIQEGNVGLVTAAKKFDIDQGVKFISYAVWWIRQAILSALANQGRAVRVPLNRASDLARIFRERERLKQELRRDPSLEELADAAKLTPEVVQQLQTLNAAEIRLDAPIGDSDDSQLVERFVLDEAHEPELAVEERLLSEHIEKALESLTPRDARVIRLYFGLESGREHTLEEIGNMLGVTRERVRQLRDRALKRLREGELGSALESYAA